MLTGCWHANTCQRKNTKIIAVCSVFSISSCKYQWHGRKETKIGWVKIRQYYLTVSGHNGLTHVPSPANISSCVVAKINHVNLQGLFMAVTCIVASEPAMLLCVHTHVHIGRKGFFGSLVFCQCKCQCLKKEE